MYMLQSVCNPLLFHNPDWRQVQADVEPAEFWNVFGCAVFSCNRGLKHSGVISVLPAQLRVCTLMSFMQMPKSQMSQFSLSKYHLWVFEKKILLNHSENQLYMYVQCVNSLAMLCLFWGLKMRKYILNRSC